MRKLIYLVSLLTIFAGCAKDKIKKTEAPGQATLLLPAKDEPCTNGIIINQNLSAVTFKWNKADNTLSYEVHIKNLETQKEITLETIDTEIQLALSSNTPFSWFIVAKGEGDKSSKSEVWKFYNSGEGKSSYAPYPADITAPLMGQELNATNGKVLLDWNGSDADNDIISYDVYFGTSSDILILKASGLTESILNDVAVSPNTTYFWKVVSKDAKGNTSTSIVYQFRVK